MLFLTLCLSADQNECESSNVRCHECTNFVGGFNCMCNDGYYHSASAYTCYGESKVYVINRIMCGCTVKNELQFLKKLFKVRVSKVT